MTIQDFGNLSLIQVELEFFLPEVMGLRSFLTGKPHWKNNQTAKIKAWHTQSPRANFHWAWMIP